MAHSHPKDQEAPQELEGSDDDSCSSSSMEDIVKTKKRLKLYVSGINRNLDDAGLRNVFNKFGTVSDVYIKADSDRRVNVPRWATLYLDDELQGQRAIAELNGRPPLFLAVRKARTDKTKQKKHDPWNGLLLSSAEEDIITTKRESDCEEKELQGRERGETLPREKTPEDLQGEEEAEPVEEKEIVQETRKVEPSELKAKVFGSPLLLSPRDPLECVACNEPGVLVCSRCRAWYCSVRCQIDDWKKREHKKVCQVLPPAEFNQV